MLVLTEKLHVTILKLKSAVSIVKYSKPPRNTKSRNTPF